MLLQKMALQDEQQIRTASSDNHSLVTANIHSDLDLPRSSLQPTALDAAALQKKDPIEQQEEFRMQVLKGPKCEPTWSGLEEQGGQVGSPGGAESRSTPTVSSHQCVPPSPICQQQKAMASPCFSCLRGLQISIIFPRSLISLCLCLQMFISVAGAFPVQKPCIPMDVILDEKLKVLCSPLDHQNTENIRRKCPQPPDSQKVPLCEDGRDSPKKGMEYGGQPVKMLEFVMCNTTGILIFHNNSGNHYCMYENVISFLKAVEQKVEDADSFGVTVPIIVSAVIVLLIVLILIGLYIKRNKLKNCYKNRSSKSQPSPCHPTSQGIQPPYVPAPNTDPDDDLHSVATNGNADTATATVDIHDAVPGETSANPTEDPYPSGASTVDTFLTADSESVNAYDSEARDSAYCDSYDCLPRFRGPWLCSGCLPGC